MKLTYLLLLLIACTIVASVNEDSSQLDVKTILQLRESVSFGYSGANSFLDLIRGLQSPSAWLEHYAEIMSLNGNRVPFRYIQPVIIAYTGFIVCLVVGISFMVLLPLVGLVFCCARLCGRCGGRIQLMDAKKDPCRRVVYTIFTVVIITVQLIAIVLAFINHSLLHEAMVNHNDRVGAIPQINYSLIRTEASLREIFKAATNSSSVNLEDRKLHFTTTVKNGLAELKQEFYAQSSADLILGSIEQLKNVTGQFTTGSKNYNLLMSFNDSITDLVDLLPSIRKTIVDTIDSDCSFEKHLECREVMQKTQTHLDVQYHVDDFEFDQLEQLLDNIQTFGKHLDELNKFNETLSSVDYVVQKSINSSLEAAWNDLAYSPTTREKLTRNIGVYLNRIYEILGRTRAVLDSEESRESREAFNRTLELCFYAGIAVLCVPVLILILATLGLCFGTCGHRPYEEAGVCNRGVGANMLLAAVGFIFLFSTILMIVCTALFLIGAPVQTELCRYLTGHVPDGPRKFDDYLHESLRYVYEKLKREHKLLAQEFARQRKENPNAPVSVVSTDFKSLELALNITRARLSDAILTRCETEPIVDAFSGINFTMPILYESVQVILRDLLDSIKNVDLVSVFKESVTDCKNALKQVSFMETINFTSAINQTNLPLLYVGDIESYLSEVEMLQIERLKEPVNALRKTVVKAEDLRLSVHPLYRKLDSIRTLWQQVDRQLTDFNNQLDNIVRVTMEYGLKNFQPVLSRELQLALIATWRDIPCRSLRLAVKGGVDAVCVTLLMPLNGIWAGLGLTLLLFIPFIIFAVKLAGLYRKTEQYSSDYEEPDYISYHGFYIRPTSDYAPGSKKSRSKKRQHKGNSNLNGPAPNRLCKLRSGSRSRYQQVSVYPYDAYE